MAYDRAALLAQLKIDEGARLHPYKDSMGLLTIGIGRNLDQVGISETEAEYLCGNDITRAEESLDRNFVGWRNFSDIRQEAIMNLCYNMGWGGLSTFRNMLAAMLAGNWDDAAAELLSSRYASQVGDRARRIAAMLQEPVTG